MLCLILWRSTALTPLSRSPATSRSRPWLINGSGAGPCHRRVLNRRISRYRGHVRGPQLSWNRLVKHLLYPTASHGRRPLRLTPCWAVAWRRGCSEIREAKDWPTRSFPPQRNSTARVNGDLWRQRSASASSNRRVNASYVKCATKASPPTSWLARQETRVKGGMLIGLEDTWSVASQRRTHFALTPWFRSSKSSPRSNRSARRCDARRPTLMDALALIGHRAIVRTPAATELLTVYRVNRRGAETQRSTNAASLHLCD